MLTEKESFLNYSKCLQPYFFYSMILIFCALFLCIKTGFAKTHDDINIEAVPDWVKTRTLSPVAQIPVDEISNGVFYRLVDSQVQVSNNGNKIRYNRYVETVVNQKGIESSSQINLDYDPSYQKLVLNTLFILRDGQRLDRLAKAKMSLFNREQELDRQIYNGTMTLNILIDDLREGDTLDYSYSRYGSNPVYKNRFSYTRTLNWSVPVNDQYLRVLWGKAQPLFINTRNIEPKIEETILGEFIEYQLHMHNEETIESSSQAPSWYDPYGTIYFSESERWPDVVNWALPLYESRAIHPSIQQLANEIKQGAQSKSEQIAIALKYTQGKIRYVGLEMGVNSHFPTAAHETLALRYGDCKDKAVLFIAILRALDINAYPALVNTEQSKLLVDIPPAENRFDHVIVTLEFEGERLWLDPTLNYQQGPLNRLFQPDYGYALILQTGQQSLTTMAQALQNSFSHISEKYLIPEDITNSANFTVRSEYFGDMAQQKYSQIERDGKKKLSQDYESYYQRFYSKLTAQSEVDIQTDNTSGILSLTEKYSIDNFWTEGKKDLEMDFFPHDIRDAVFKPDQINRNSPLSFAFPNNIKNQTIVEFEEDGWEFSNEEFIEDNAFFFFKKNIDFKNNTLVLNYEFRAKTDHIPHAKIETYLAARKKVREKAYYGIVKYVKNEPAEQPTENGNDTSLWLGIFIFIYLLGVIFIIVSWRLESRKRPNISTSNFYPMSLSKFLALSISTFGAYIYYWMYRNWKFIQLKENVSMMPIARGIFSAFWFYPLFKALKQDSELRFNENKVLATTLAVIFAIAYFVISVILNQSEQTDITLVYLILPLLFIPCVNYINVVNSEDTQGYDYNSKWKIRHIITMLLFMPLWGLTVAEEGHFMPSSSVVTADGIMSRDMNFLHRQKIVPPDEEINFFYSDAFFSIRDDGNGFTQKRVFSYWLDESDKLQREIVTFDQIKDIEVKYAANEMSNTVITITRMDESNFMLFVSAEDKGDKLFVTKLKAQWKRQS